MHHKGLLPEVNWLICGHNIIQFESTKTKTKRAFDSTGSQFGIHQALWEWFDYERRFIDVWKPVKIYQGGMLEAYICTQGKIPGFPSMTVGLEVEKMKWINERARTWADGRSLGLPGLVHAEGDKFLEGKQELLMLVKVSASEFINQRYHISDNGCAPLRE